MVVQYCEVLCYYLENFCKCKFDLFKYSCKILNVME